jgi:hypothetical protein
LLLAALLPPSVGVVASLPPVLLLMLFFSLEMDWSGSVLMSVLVIPASLCATLLLVLVSAICLCLLLPVLAEWLLPSMLLDVMFGPVICCDSALMPKRQS